MGNVGSDEPGGSDKQTALGSSGLVREVVLPRPGNFENFMTSLQLEALDGLHFPKKKLLDLNYSFNWLYDWNLRWNGHPSRKHKVRK